MILLNPGPVTLTNQVKQAQLQPDLCHREQDFQQLFNKVKHQLLSVYQLNPIDYDCLLISGSGTAAVEAMLSTFVAPHQPVFVVSNGVYGERMLTMLRRQQKQAVHVQADWQQPIDLSAIEQALQQHPTARYVATVHHETTTGRLNDIAGLAELCRRYDKEILLDAVSSFAGEAIGFSNWPLAACAATANKCLHGVPGLAFVIAKQRLLTDAVSHAASLYLDLITYYQAQQNNTVAFTPPIQTFYALSAALDELAEQGGWHKRRVRYLSLSTRLRQQLPMLGFDLLLEASAYASMLSAFKLPHQIAYADLHGYLKQHGYIIYAGQGRLRENLFRLATMGAILETDIEQLLELLYDFQH